jgi:predicted nucleotidyltransferase
MIDELTKNITQELINDIKFQYSDFIGLYLFGSRARGDSNIYSDYDIAFVFKEKIDFFKKREIRSIICKIMLKYNVIIDNPFLNNENLLYPDTPLIENILKEGIFFEAA